MAGESNLRKLISAMTPVLGDEELVFCSVLPVERPSLKINPILEFREREGVTLILTEIEAREAGLEFQFPCKMVTLNIHSSLEAVGFLAVITSELAKEGICVNVVSALYHDHLFVNRDTAGVVINILNRLSQEASARS